MAKVSNNKKVVSVIVTYNRKELLKECINALLNQNYDNCDILVVDNASTDGTKEYIKKELQNKKVHYSNTGANLGGAGGFNYGIKEAYKLGCDFIWIMDDDCIVHNDSLTELLKADKELNGNYGFLSSKVLWKDNSICKMNIQKITMTKWLKDYDKNYQSIVLASFVSLFIKRDIVEEFGLPIKEFFIWTDDWEYTRRISRKKKCYYISSSVVTHKSKENVGASIATVDDRLERFNYLYRNDCVLYRGEGIKGWFLLKIRLILHKLRILRSDKKDKKERINIINNAIKEGKKFFPKIEFPFPIRVLQIFGEPLSNGGQESAIMNLYRNIDRSKVQFDFYTPFYNDNLKMKDEIEKLGGTVYSSGSKFETKLRKFYFIRNTKKFLKNNPYYYVHINSGSLFQLAKGSKIAYKFGAKKIIVHTHSTGCDSIKYRLARTIYGNYFNKYPTNIIACSKLAAEWKYPTSVIKEKKYKIIRNGIDINKFSFDLKIRNKYRKELNIEKNKVLINVGRLSTEKNQLFLIDIMKELIKIDSSYILLICGTGDLENKLKEKIINDKLNNYVKLLGLRNDISELLSASDVFVFPSLWEGSPVSTVEAQGTGLAVICSDTITEEAKINKNFKFENLDNGALTWARSIVEVFNDNANNDRRENSNLLKEMGYDAKDTALELLDIYLN